MDHGREDVYAAELAAFDGTELEALAGSEELRECAARVMAGGWWNGPLVVVRAARSDARSSTTRNRGTHAEIRLAADQSTPATLIHELAHALAGVDAGHG